MPFYAAPLELNMVVNSFSINILLLPELFRFFSKKQKCYSLFLCRLEAYATPVERRVSNTTFILIVPFRLRKIRQVLSNSMERNNQEETPDCTQK